MNLVKRRIVLLTSVLAAAVAPVVVAGPAPAGARPASSVVAAASSTPPAPHGMWVSASGADRLRWAWTSVSGATGYRIAISTSARMSNPQIRVVSGRWATFVGLRPGTIYYAVVRTLAGTEVSGVSAKIPGIPGQVVKPLGSVPLNQDAVAWRWAPYVGATKYQVRLATSSDMKANVTYYKLSGRTITLAVERDSYGWFQVRALNAHGWPITPWSATARAYVPYHPV